jgi:hypothetical protein
VLGNHPDRPRAGEVAQQAQGLALVLDDLVGDVAQARRRHRMLGERAIAFGVDDRPAGGEHGLVGLLLRPVLGDRQRAAGALDQAGDRGDGRVCGSAGRGASVGIVHRSGLAMAKGRRLAPAGPRCADPVRASCNCTACTCPAAAPAA